MALEFAVGFVARVASDQSREERGFDERDHMTQYTSLPYTTPAVQRPIPAAPPQRRRLKRRVMYQAELEAENAQGDE